MGAQGPVIDLERPATVPPAGPDPGPLSMRFWGTRGSLPIAGPSTVHYGGNTACVEVRLGERLFILDAGSGIAPLGTSRTWAPGTTVDLLLTHLHHDHIGGLFFFMPLFTPGITVRIWCGNLDGHTAEAALRRMFSPPLFPISFEHCAAKVEFIGFKAGQTLVFEDGIRVRTHPLVHPSGATAYRFDHGGRAISYVTDIEHTDAAPEPGLVAFCAGSDLIVYDAMLTETQYAACRGWGHSTWGAGVTLCRAAASPRLLCFHHHPKHCDTTIAGLEADLASTMPGSGFAREGQVEVLAPVLVNSMGAGY